MLLNKLLPKKQGELLKPLLYAGIFIVLVFTGCCCNQNCYNKTLTNAQLDSVLKYNNTFFDSVCGGKTRSATTQVTNQNRQFTDIPLTLKDTAYIYFSYYPMYLCTGPIAAPVKGAAISAGPSAEFVATYGGSAGTYTIEIGVTSNLNPGGGAAVNFVEQQNTAGTLTPYDYRIAIPLPGLNGAENAIQAGTVTPAHPAAKSTGIGGWQM